MCLDPAIYVLLQLETGGLASAKGVGCKTKECTGGCKSHLLLLAALAGGVGLKVEPPDIVLFLARAPAGEVGERLWRKGQWRIEERG